MALTQQQTRTSHLREPGQPGFAAPPQNALRREAEQLDWLQLYRSDNVGPQTFRQLTGRFGSAGAAISALPDLARKAGAGRRIKLASRKACEQELDRLRALGGQLLTTRDPDYPAALRQCEDAPPVLSALGHTHLTGRNAIALVGARNASVNGVRFAGQLSAALGSAGWLSVSGLARGIDTAVHRAGLQSGTIAVIANGLDHHYPPENRALQDQIAEAGLILSESPLGATPVARAFPRRNRIIAGMTAATVVVEATLKSGSLITARCANDYGRPVFAVPNFPSDPRAAGGNHLIREGATLITGAADLLKDLAPMTTPDALPEPTPEDFWAATAMLDAEDIDKARAEILLRLSGQPAAFDDLLQVTGLPPAIALAAIAELELAGLIHRHPGNAFSLAL